MAMAGYPQKVMSSTPILHLPRNQYQTRPIGIRVLHCILIPYSPYDSPILHRSYTVFDPKMPLEAFFFFSPLCLCPWCDHRGRYESVDLTCVEENEDAKWQQIAIGVVVVAVVVIKSQVTCYYYHWITSDRPYLLFHNVKFPVI